MLFKQHKQIVLTLLSLRHLSPTSSDFKEEARLVVGFFISGTPQSQSLSRPRLSCRSLCIITESVTQSLPCASSLWHIHFLPSMFPTSFEHAKTLYHFLHPSQQPIEQHTHYFITKFQFYHNVKYYYVSTSTYRDFMVDEY